MFSSKRERSGAELLPRSDEAFAERLDMLASTVSATAAALAKTDGDIVGLRRELGSGLARVEELTAELRSRARASDVHELQKKVGSLTFETTAKPETKRLDDLGSKVSMLAERVDTLASTVATTASSVAGRDGEVAALRKQFGQGPQGGTVDAALLRRVEDAASASASASLRVESYGEQIAALAGRVDETGERLAELAERLATAELERAALTTSIADAAETLRRELGSALGDLVARLGAAEERGAQVAAELARAKSLWPAALRALETRVDELARASGPGGGERSHIDDRHVLVALRTLEQRMHQADEAARAEREAVVERLERLSVQLDARQDFVPAAVEVLPFATER